MTIQEQTEALLHQRSRVNEMMEALKVEKLKRDEMQVGVMAELTRQGFNSVKIGSTTVSKAIKKTMKIINESDLIKDLDNKGLKSEYVKEQIDKDLWKGLSSQLAKEGKTFEGTEINETEYISIRTNKPKK